eukprot:m.233395 g.233395  ORF g.233395 m.233395 type:complete len:163 (+) comp19124_c0_seq1:126-614(+)
MEKGIGPNIYQNVSKKLQLPAETVQQAIEGIMYLYTECSKLQVSEMDFHDSMMTVGFPEDLIQLLQSVYVANIVRMRAFLSKISMGVPSYENLQWRLDVQIASRTLRGHVEPSVVLQLQTSDDKQHTMATDPATLAHITQQLEAALKELKSAHFRRSTRLLK